MAEAWDDLIRELARREQRGDWQELLAEILREAIATREHPGIYFAAEPAGRVAKVVGTGLAVWELVQSWRDAGKDDEALLGMLPNLARWQLDAALGYYKQHEAEITGLIEDNRRQSAEDFRPLLPGLIVE
jgi:uncharacterized protein (DUF433 family)